MGRRLIPKNGNDVVYTPYHLAHKIVNHFNIAGRVLDPCKGDGAFYNFLKRLPSATHVAFCEITEGKDFFLHRDKYDWIITNPPWSLFKEFLQHSCQVSDNIVFLVTINHFMTKARLNILKQNNFGITEIYCVDTPKDKSWPQSGFQLAAVHIQRNYKGDIKWNF